MKACLTIVRDDDRAEFASMDAVVKDGTHTVVAAIKFRAKLDRGIVSRCWNIGDGCRFAKLKITQRVVASCLTVDGCQKQLLTIACSIDGAKMDVGHV